MPNLPAAPTINFFSIAAFAANKSWAPLTTPLTSAVFKLFNVSARACLVCCASFDAKAAPAAPNVLSLILLYKIRVIFLFKHSFCFIKISFKQNLFTSF